MQVHSTSEYFLTPTELCERWKIDPRTLDKLELPWFWVTPRKRRLPVDVVTAYEKAQKLGE